MTSRPSDAQPWASECLDVKNYKWRLNPVWHRMLYSCTHVATVGVKGLNITYITQVQCVFDSWLWRTCTSDFWCWAFVRLSLASLTAFTAVRRTAEAGVSTRMRSTCLSARSVVTPTVWRARHSTKGRHVGTIRTALRFRPPSTSLQRRRRRRSR